VQRHRVLSADGGADSWGGQLGQALKKEARAPLRIA